MFVLRPLSDLVTRQFLYQDAFDLQPVFEPALGAALLGCAALQAGYVLPTGSRLGQRVPGLPRVLNVTERPYVYH
jgi:hypothetical protein